MNGKIYPTMVIRKQAEAIELLEKENEKLKNIISSIKKDFLNANSELEEYKARNEKAIDIAYEYGQIDGEHHKTWCIDQMLRALADNNYNKFVKEYENNGEYKWNIGIAP